MIVCKWCRSQVKFGKGPQAVPEWRRWQCEDCGAIGYQKVPATDELSAIYKAAWHDSTKAGKFASGSTSEAIADSIVSVMTDDLDLGSCLDYGGGKGLLAKSLCKKGAFEIYVIEPFGSDPKIPQVVWLSDLADLPSGKKFDWVFMVEVIEHLLDPVYELAKIREYLKPTGKLVITTPNSKGWRARLGRANWREAQNPTHINLFSLTALRTCLQRAGFAQVNRVRKPVRYNATGLSEIILAVTQMIGIDGGLRVVASLPKGKK